MKAIKHTLEFVTELDETDPTAQRLLSLPANEAQTLLKNMLIDMFSMRELINTVNEGNSWATLKLVNK